jgi:hypothetical protein
MPQEKPRRLHMPRKGESARRIEVYSEAYRLAWERVPLAERRTRADISLRIHAFIRRQLKDGASSIASAAVNDAIANQ